MTSPLRFGRHFELRYHTPGSNLDKDQQALRRQLNANFLKSLQLKDANGKPLTRVMESSREGLAGAGYDRVSFYTQGGQRVSILSNAEGIDVLSPKQTDAEVLKQLRLLQGKKPIAWFTRYEAIAASNDKLENAVDLYRKERDVIWRSYESLRRQAVEKMIAAARACAAK